MRHTKLNHTIIAALALAVGLAVGLALAKADEKSSVYQSLLAKYDANKDGRLDAAEREVIRTDRLKPASRERSGQRSFRYPDTVIARFDKDDDNELEGEEFAAAREWVDRRFKEINAEYDADKDGRLNTAERAALSKQIEAGKFEDMGWLTRYLVRSRGILRKSDKDRDGRLSEKELTAARAALKKFEAERDREERTGIRRVPSRGRR